jgi:hypothetical protein
VGRTIAVIRVTRVLALSYLVGVAGRDAAPAVLSGFGFAGWTSTT